MPNDPIMVIKRRAKAPHLLHFHIVIVLDPPPPYVWKRDKLRADLGGLCEDLTGGPLFGPDYHAPAPHADQTVVFQLMHPNHHSLYEAPLDDVDSQVLLSPGSFSRDGKIIKPGFQKKLLAVRQRQPDLRLALMGARLEVEVTAMAQALVALGLPVTIIEHYSAPRAAFVLPEKADDELRLDFGLPFKDEEQY